MHEAKCTLVREMEQALATCLGGVVLHVESVFYGHVLFLTLKAQPFGCSLE